MLITLMGAVKYYVNQLNYTLGVSGVPSSLSSVNNTINYVI